MRGNHARLTANLAVALLALVGCGAHAQLDRFGGTWRLDDGRTVRLVRAGTCKGNGVLYRATYFNGRAHLTGCAHGRILIARFNDNGVTGTITQRLTSPDRWVATVDGDNGPAFRVTARRIRR